MRRMYEVLAEKMAGRPDSLERRIEFRIGVAFVADGVDVVRIRIDALPLGFDGKLVIRLDRPVSEIEDRAKGERP